MEIYSTSFTLPRPSGAVAFTGDSLGSTEIAASNSPDPLVPLSIFSNGEANRNLNAPTRSQEGHTGSGRMSAMRSRLPPSVKAFMPAAFGGSKRTSERIAEVVGSGTDRDGEADAEAEDVAGNAEDAAKVPNETQKKENGGKGTPEEELFPKLSSGSKMEQRTTAAKNRDSRSTMGTNSSMDFSSAASVSADSTAASTAPALGSSKPANGSIFSQPEPRSASHSASGSFSAFGLQHQIPTTVDLTESMQRLSVEAMSSHQCLVSFTAMSGSPNNISTVHANGSSTSLSSDPYHRHAFPSLPGPATLPFPSQYPYQQYAQGFDATPSDNSGFPSSAFSTIRGNLLGQSSVSMPLTDASSIRSGTQSIFKHSGNQTSAPLYNFHLSGGYQQVMAARGQVLRDHPFKTRLSIKVPRNDLLDALPGTSTQQQGIIPSDYLKPDIRRRLDEIAVNCKCYISIVSNEYYGPDLGCGLATERSVEVVISGQFEGAEHARVRVMVMLDELSGLHSEACEIDYKLHNIVGGRKRCVVQTIQEETGTNIYLPTPFSGVLASSRTAAIFSRQNTVYLTGEYFGVQRAKEMLFQVSLHKSKSIISRDTAVLPRKIDWMLLEQLEELRSIMMDDATFIHLPMLGSQASLITVYGDNRISIERSIRSVMQLAGQFYIASLWLLPPTFDSFAPPPTLHSTQVTPLIKQVSNASGAEVVFKGNCFEMHGLESQVRQAVMQLLDLDVVQPFHTEIRFQIELANEHREFISGKKNGKINKIMKQGVRIKFETFNDYNFLIDISSNDRTGALQGLNLLLEELPAEVSFHIPESYHKRIIGVGGKNIQRTMKKFGVYVKFYSKQDLDMETYPFLNCEDNVIARTPAKNSANLEQLKVAVMELVSPKDRDFVTETVPIARRYHRTLLSEKGIFIHDIEAKLGCMIRFPSPESASDLVVIFGPESQINIAAQMLLDHVPFEAEYRTPNSADLERLLTSHEFVALTERVKRDLNIAISPALHRSSSTVIGSSSSKGEVIFKLRLNRSNADFLTASKDALEDFLISRNIDIYESQDRQRSDSFASSFPHFANKLISTVPQAAESTDSFQTDSATRYHHQQQQQQQQEAQEHNRLRAAASTPDIKALFDSPNTQQGLFYPSNPAPLTSMVSANDSPLTSSSIYTSPYQDGSTTASSLGGDVWGAPKFLHRGATSSTSSTGPGIAFPPSRTSRLSDDANTFHQPTHEADLNDLDPMKALRKPRSFSHRTQSLDIGALAAQQVIQQAIAANPGMISLDRTVRTSAINPANTSPNFTMSQRPFGAIGSSPYALNSGNSGNQHLNRGSSNDFTHSMAATTTTSFAPRQQHHHHHQQYPSQQFTTLPHQHRHQQQSQSNQHYQSHHHHVPSISRLAPSAIQHAPEPETADEVLRSLAQLHFPSSSS